MNSHNDSYSNLLLNECTFVTSNKMLRWMHQQYKTILWQKCYSGFVFKGFAKDTQKYSCYAIIM